MSSEGEENSLHIEGIDLDSPDGKPDNNVESFGDSGLDTLNSCSESIIASVTEFETQPQPLSAAVTQNGSVSQLSSPVSTSPDINDATDKSVSLDELPDNISEGNDHIMPTKDIKSEAIIESADDKIETDISDHISAEPGVLTLKTTSEDQIECMSGNKELIMELATKNDLTTSTVSLNEQVPNKNNIPKSMYSRSAENISTIVPQPPSLNSSNKELDKEAILTEFSHHKSKATATQKIVPDNPQTVDARYTRIPKEILSQDIGSIVKNVHGIFSSVSGSLKNAYTHRNVQKPVKPVRAIPNGKIMNDIFETEDTAPVKVEPKAPVTNNPNETFKIEQETAEGEDLKKDLLKLQIESLERLLAEQRKENGLLKERTKLQMEELQAKEAMFKEIEVKMDLMSKRVEVAEREKDAAVMRYASVECAKIEARRAADKATVAERAATAETELLNNKIRSAHAEKQRICQLYDDKCHELMDAEKEISKIREEVKELEGRLKWTQSKLRMEMDAYRDSAEKVEKLTQQVQELESARDVAAANSLDLVKAKQLEQELKETRAALILCRHEREELERKFTTLSHQLETAARERDNASGALAQATDEVSQLKQRTMQLEEEAAELAALRAQAALADTLTAQLQRETERAVRAEEALGAERARAETCARREASALEHAARLTAQHVAQRARHADHENKTTALSLDNAALRERVCALEGEATRHRHELSETRARRDADTRALARKVAELTEELAEANKKLEWEKGENGVLKKKHSSAVKELNRELQRAMKRCEQLEAKLPPDVGSNSTGSISSLSSGEGAAQEERLQNVNSETIPDIQVREPDRQALIERIVSLQRAAARRAERCEFLEEHSKQLTGELRAKSRLLRHLLCSMPTGALATDKSDKNKEEIARLGGGAMAAVWGGPRGAITLPLSLEMNARLQAVCEDALLRNMTLQENMDTLGAEIARLKGIKKPTESN